MMSKKQMFSYLVHELRFTADNPHMNYERKLDQCFGYIKAMSTCFPDEYEEITEIWETFRAAIHPAYKTTYETFLNETEKYLVPVWEM